MANGTIVNWQSSPYTFKVQNKNYIAEAAISKMQKLKECHFYGYTADTVNEANLDKFAHSQETISVADNDDGRYNVRIGLFGSVKDAEIVNLTIDNINISVAEEVYSYIDYKTNGFKADHEVKSINELIVGTVAGYAKNSTISVNVTGNIDADAYAFYIENI